MRDTQKLILVVDDEPATRYAVRRALEQTYRIAEADSAESARAAMARLSPDLILLDLVMPGEGGLSVLRWMRDMGHDQPVLIVSALDTAHTAVEALQQGAADYLVKGFDLEELRKRVATLVRLAGLERENESLRARLVVEGEFGGMVGSSGAMRRVFEMADRVAPTDATVLILGESGTGKDLLAEEIHARSARAGRPFVAVNCAALPETLIESELFGYERGAFTGAAQLRKGKFEQASTGTLFLDEIGDMNPVTQAKVLRVLENRKVERLGGTQSVPVDVRVISATHRNLPVEIAAGRFREDLFYRLRVVTIDIPPLRARKEDIPLLAEAILRRLGAQHGRRAALSPASRETLLRCDWPGNVRELRNALEHALIFSQGTEIAPSSFSAEVTSGSPLVAKTQASASRLPLEEEDYREAKKKFEMAFITKKLEENRWNVSRTAAAIGLHRQSLQEKLRELGIERPGKAPPTE